VRRLQCAISKWLPGQNMLPCIRPLPEQCLTLGFVPLDQVREHCPQDPQLDHTPLSGIFKTSLVS
jgi:hypothetical protein